MPRLFIVAVGDKLPAWAGAACDEYLKRLPRGFEASLVEVRAEPRTSGKTPEQLMAAEAARLRAALPRGGRLVSLDERGKDFTTAQFSAKLRGWLDWACPRPSCSADRTGSMPALKRECELLLRLSSFTLPHALARAVFAEQLYRAASLLTGHPYHRE